MSSAVTVPQGATDLAIINFFDHPRFRGLWYFKTVGNPRRYTVTYHALDGEFVETDDQTNWRGAMLAAMRAVGVRP